MTVVATVPGVPRTPSAADLDRLLLIRVFETTLLDLFAAGQISGTTHTCLGQEHIPVALMPLLRDGDQVFSNHRGHGHYLARYDDPEGLLAEILGRGAAPCAGVGGSQHLRRDGFLSTGIQGSSMPVAAGVALHFQAAGAPHVAVAFIGDGTWGEGVVYEALNLGALWSLPLVVVVENNGIAQSTETRMQMAGTITARAAAFGIAYLGLDGVDVGDLRAAMAGPLADVRRGAGPLIIEVRTGRLGPHSKGDDHRDAAELARLRSQDWYERYRASCPAELAESETRQRRRVDDLVRRTLAMPPTRWSPV